MKKTIFVALLLVFSAVLVRPASAQEVVSAPDVDTAIGTATSAIDGAIGTAATTINTNATRIQTETLAPTMTAVQSINTMLNTPTVITGVFSGMDGGATTNSTTETTGAFSALSGSSLVGASAIKLDGEESTGLTADEGEALVTGNSAAALARRQKRTTANIQGQAVTNLGIYDARFGTSDAMEAKLSALKDIKEVMTYEAGLSLQNNKGLNLLGQSIELNTMAVTQSENDKLAENQREQDERKTEAAVWVAAAAANAAAAAVSVAPW